MNRVIFLNRFFYPDHSATSQILSDLAFYLAALGWDIHVVTSRMLYDNPKVDLPPHELVRGVNIHRLRTTRFGRVGLPGRVMDYASFYSAICRHLLAHVRNDDIVVAKTDPPFLSIPAIRIARRRGFRVVNWLHDIYPEIAVELGVPLLKGPIGWALASMRDRSLQEANANIVLGERMASRLRKRGVPTDRIHIIPNWTDDEQITAVAPADNPLRSEWNLQGKFVVGYSGNLGRAHEFETVISAAGRLRDDRRIVFVFVGGGFQHSELARRVREQKLDHLFRFFPYQDRQQLKFSLSVPDLHWISLKSELEGLIFPSKLYGVAAAGRPIIAISAKDGEIASLVEKHQCGFGIAPGDSIALAEIIRTLSGQPEQCATMGHRARAMLDEHFTRRQGFERWRHALESVGNSSTP